MKTINPQKTLAIIFAVLGNVFLIWFYLKPLLLLDSEFITGGGILFMGVEMLALCCELVMNTSRDSSNLGLDKKARFNQYLGYAYLFVFSLVWVGMASWGLNNFNILLVFVLSLATKFLLHFVAHIPTNAREVAINISILMVCVLPAVLTVIFVGPVWGILYYSVTLIRNIIIINKSYQAV